MAKDNEKLRGSYLFNFKSRSPETVQKVSNWLDAQQNVSNSLISLIEHSIDRFGTVNITDHEISKKLHTELLHFSNPNNTPHVVSQTQAQTARAEEYTSVPDQQAADSETEDSKPIQQKVVKTETSSPPEQKKNINDGFNPDAY